MALWSIGIQHFYFFNRWIKFGFGVVRKYPIIYNKDN